MSSHRLNRSSLEWRRLHAAAWEICPKSACTYFCTSARNVGSRSRFLMNSAASMRSVRPATCEIARTASDPPGTSGTPTMPSLPIVRHLDDVAVGQRRDQGDDAVHREVHMRDRLPGVEQHRLDGEVSPAEAADISVSRSASGSASSRWFPAGAPKVVPFGIGCSRRLPQSSRFVATRIRAHRRLRLAAGRRLSCCESRGRIAPPADVAQG